MSYRQGRKTKLSASPGEQRRALLLILFIVSVPLLGTVAYAARNGRRYGGVVGLSGGLIGPPGTRWDYPATLDGTPAFLGCSDVDFHIPKQRVDESAEALERLGARVTERIYPGMGHTVNADELNAVQGLMHEVLTQRG